MMTALQGSVTIITQCKRVGGQKEEQLTAGGPTCMWPWVHQIRYCSSPWRPSARCRPAPRLPCEDGGQRRQVRAGALTAGLTGYTGQKFILRVSQKSCLENGLFMAFIVGRVAQHPVTGFLTGKGLKSFPPHDNWLFCPLNRVCSSIPHLKHIQTLLTATHSHTNHIIYKYLSLLNLI